MHLYPAQVVESITLCEQMYFVSSGSWKDMKYKAYNFDAQGIMPTSGHLHPLMKVRAQFRQIFLEMGYVKDNHFLCRIYSYSHFFAMKLS